MRRWWRRNRIALGAMVLGVAATILVSVVVPYREWLASNPVPRSVAAGHDAESDGARFRVLKAGEFHSDGKPAMTLPSGTEILAVLLRVRAPSGLDRSCTVELVHDGTDRISWDPQSDPSRFGYGLSPRTAHLCTLEKAGSTTVELTFLVPEGTYTRSRLVVTTFPSDGRPGSTDQVALELPSGRFSNRDG